MKILLQSRKTQSFCFYAIIIVDIESNVIRNCDQEKDCEKTDPVIEIVEL